MPTKPEGPAQEPHGSDICQCGDFRSQHALGTSPACSCDRCRCGGFIFVHAASERDRAAWDKYRSPEAVARARKPVPATPAPSQPAAHTEPHGAFFQPHVIPKFKGCPDCEAVAKRVTVLGQTRPENIGLTPLMEACDREWSDETPEQVIAIAANAIYWRNREIQQLREHNAPSQPAGAREWPRQEPCPERDGDGCAACLADVDEWFRINRPKLHDALKYAAGEMGKAFDIIVFEACTAFLAQQTAAKDAAILYECEQKVAAIEELLAATDRAEAAERERDSLQEALDALDLSILDHAAERLAQLGGGPMVDRLRLLATEIEALKAGKGGQQ